MARIQNLSRSRWQNLRQVILWCVGQASRPLSGFSSFGASSKTKHTTCAPPQHLRSKSPPRDLRHRATIVNNSPGLRARRAREINYGPPTTNNQLSRYVTAWCQRGAQARTYRSSRGRFGSKPGPELLSEGRPQDQCGSNGGRNGINQDRSDSIRIAPDHRETRQNQTASPKHMES